MKKILFIEYTLEVGHVNYNHIHINALMAQGFDVRLVLHQYTKDRLPFADSQYALVLPHFLRRRNGWLEPLRNRIIYLLTLLYIRLKVNLNDYDQVILSSFDEVTLAMLPLCRNMRLTSHGNGLGFENPIKRKLLKRIARHNTFIVFNEEMRQPFLENGIEQVDIVSHGCIPPYQNLPPTTVPIDMRGYDTVIFHPSPSPDPDFITQLTGNAELQHLLENENILLILRNCDEKNLPSANIKTINQYLSTMEYQQMFLCSDIILIAYPDDFRYRVSGVSYECIANGKRLLARQIPALNYCRAFYNYNPMFADVSQLCECIIELKRNPEKQCVANAESLIPDYRSVVNRIKS